MRRTLFFLILLSFGIVQADVRSEQLLTRDLAVVIKSMPKAINLYTYFNILQITGELSTPAGRDGFNKRFFAGSLLRYWEPALTNGSYINAGPGLYAAIDPHISKSYGNMMLDISIKPGTRFIDLHVNTPLGSDTVEALVSEGIVPRGMLSTLFVLKGQRYEFSSVTLKTMIRPELMAFRKMVQEILNAQSVEMAEYNWDTSVPGFCRLQRYSAFVIFGLMRSAGIAYSMANTLVTEAELPALSDSEKATAGRDLKFRQVLDDVKKTTGYGAKVNTVRKAYPDEIERNELINQTYSCEK